LQAGRSGGQHILQVEQGISRGWQERPNTLDIRDATSDEVRRLKDENGDLKKAVAELALDVIRYKKSLGMS
jgi:hypothetical protein